MADGSWVDLIAELRTTGIEFAEGLTNAEVAAVEARYEFRFPPDLLAFLQAGLPQGERFPDWRSGTESSLRNWFDLPREGIVFDVEHNAFWLDEWGQRPPRLAEALRVADQLIAAAPRLVPIYAHRMMPTEPHLPGNPVFSVHQTDIIIYGINLRAYLVREFLAREDEDVLPNFNNTRPIKFWDINRFQEVRWDPDGSCILDNSSGQRP